MDTDGANGDGYTARSSGRDGNCIRQVLISRRLAATPVSTSWGSSLLLHSKLSNVIRGNRCPEMSYCCKLIWRISANIYRQGRAERTAPRGKYTLYTECNICTCTKDEPSSTENARTCLSGNLGIVPKLHRC